MSRFVLLLGLVACGGGGEGKADPTAPEPTPDPTTEPTTEPTTDESTLPPYLAALGLSQAAAGGGTTVTASFVASDAFSGTPSTSTSGTFPLSPGACTVSSTTPSTSTSTTSSSSSTTFDAYLDPGDVTVLLDGAEVPVTCPLPGVCFGSLDAWPAGATLGVRAPGSAEFPPVEAPAAAIVPPAIDAEAAWLADGALEVSPLLSGPPPVVLYLVAVGSEASATCLSDAGQPMVLSALDVEALGRVLLLQVVGLDAAVAPTPDPDVQVGATFFPSVTLRLPPQ